MAQKSTKIMTKAELLKHLENTGKSGKHEDVDKACHLALDYAKETGADNEYETAVPLLNNSAVPVPGTKTIWTERRLREFVDLGVKRPGL